MSVHLRARAGRRLQEPPREQPVQGAGVSTPTAAATYAAAAATAAAAAASATAAAACIVACDSTAAAAVATARRVRAELKRSELTRQLRLLPAVAGAAKSLFEQRGRQRRVVDTAPEAKVDARHRRKAYLSTTTPLLIFSQILQGWLDLSRHKCAQLRRDVCHCAVGCAQNFPRLGSRRPWRRRIAGCTCGKPVLPSE
eukprot:6698706-Prymnesium_polylepis.1